jgi:hypothetical protein
VYGWNENLREIQAALRSHEQLLLEFGLSVEATERSDDGKVKELENRLRVSETNLEKKQIARNARFEKIVVAADRGWGGTPFLSAMLRDFRNDLSKIPTDVNSSSFDGPFRNEERFLEHAISRLEEELKSRGVELKEQDPINAITGEIRKKVQIEARLREQCEEDVKMYPEQEESIRRSYRRAIDALREQE